MRQTLCSSQLCLSLTVPSSAQQASDKPWRFCCFRGFTNRTLLASARSVLPHDVEFYWHLGDFRIGYDVDEDMQQSGRQPSIVIFIRNRVG